MKKLIIIAVLLLQAWIVSAQSSDSSVIVFQHANVIDGVSNKPLLDVSVMIANGKIAAIGKRVNEPSRAEIIDLNGKWLLPGYIDAHVHINFEQAQRALRLGVTTARTMSGGVDLEIKDAHNKGRIDLPEILASGAQVRPDMPSLPGFAKNFPELADIKAPVTGGENVRRVVRALASRGVDHIKVLATERAGTPGTDPRKRTFTDEELIAIVDEAKKAGLKVAAHAHSDDGAYAAVKAGVRSIEHGTWITERTLRLMKSQGTWFDPTILYWDTHQPSDPILVERARTMRPLVEEVTRKAHKMGIPIVGGTDFSYDDGQLSIADNSAILAHLGRSKMEAIKAITSKSAKLLEIDHRTGIIRKGLEADIVVLGADPLSSIAALKDIRMIVNDGKVVFNRTHEARQAR